MNNRMSSYRYQPIREAIDRIAAEHNYNPEAVLEVLTKIQEHDGHLDQESILDVARTLKIPAEKVQGVATFFTMLKTQPSLSQNLHICDGPVCWLHKAAGILKAAKLDLPEWRVERNSCLGLCDRAPAALINGTQSGPFTENSIQSIRENPNHIPKFLEPGRNPSYTQPRPGETRVLLADINQIDPTSLDDGLKFQAYAALKNILLSTSDQNQSLQGDHIIEEIKASGLRGRGGAGFPVGTKWGFVKAEHRRPKYVVCNADESEPLVFKDRILIERKPHQLLEGMIIAGFAVGAEEGFIYIRGEYEKQARLLENSIAQAIERGYLGTNIMNSAFSFHIHVHRGAGAYICGEETALLESLEGKRGEPRIRPPYPTANGYHGLPTLVNNVETFSAVPAIIRNGSNWYKSLSTSASPGTKLFTLTGHINHPGAFELTYGYTLREIIQLFGGGMKPGSDFHFALCGGAAGYIIPETLLDVPLDYDAGKNGVTLGAGSFLVCDHTVSPIEVLRELMHFFEVESCGKCTPCRFGTKLARETLDRILSGEKTRDNLQKLTELANMMGTTSFCGLGQSTALPILSTIKHFGGYFLKT